MFGDLLATGSSVIAKASNLGISGLKFNSKKHYGFSGKDVKENIWNTINGKGNYSQVSQLESQLSEEEKSVRLYIEVAPKAGDSFSSLSVYKVSDGEAVTLNFNPEDNKLYLLDFWATWCGPCQEPMKHNQEMLERNPSWEGLAEIIAVSLDDTKEDPDARMREKGWNKITSYWAGAEGFGSTSAKSLGIEGIPSCFLVRNGKLLWSGHPAKVDLEKLINEGIAGSPLSLPPPPPEVGDPCPTLNVLDTNTEEAVALTWREDDGNVYLIDFWATWCGPCQKPMQHNQDMLASHPEWAGKFVILAISLDDGKDEVIERYNQRGWTLVRNLWAGPKGFDESAPQIFGVDGIPTCVLVHKGKVLWKGHPSERKFEQDVDALLKGEPFPTKYQQGEVHLISKEEYDGRIEALKKVYEEFISANPYIEPPTINFDAKLSQTADSHEETQESFIYGEYSATEKDVAASLADKVKDVFPEAEIRVKAIPAEASCERGNQCNLCNAPLTPNDIQYQCLYCDPKHYHCENCEKVVKEGIAGSAKFAHPHSVFVIHPAAQKLDFLKFGASTHEKTEFAEDQEDKKHWCGCDNRNTGHCDGTVAGTRYKCAHCPDFDYCQACQEKYEAKEEKTIAWADSHGHRSWHIMIKLRIP
ncbi:unnamed protein product [Blepharisma stoltei]|uniref:Thioredoxin domain-containing protein n=1 Tax=Blepharisma stoltei TaxID=1481888 RepID=A0AAU9IPS7_9CILI|nr:unnamed protein product [Blepharisma stoltei]